MEKESNKVQNEPASLDAVGLSTTETSGRKKILSKNQMEELYQALSCDPKELGYADPFWSIPLVQHYVENKFGEKVSESTAHRYLSPIENRATKTITCGEPYKQKFVKDIEPLLSDQCPFWMLYYATILQFDTIVSDEGLLLSRRKCFIFILISIKNHDDCHFRIVFRKHNTDSKKEFIHFVTKFIPKKRSYTYYLILDYDTAERALLETFYGKFTDLRVLFMPTIPSAKKLIDLKTLDYFEAAINVWLDYKFLDSKVQKGEEIQAPTTREIKEYIESQRSKFISKAILK